MLFEPLDLAMPEALTPGIFSWMSQYFTFLARISFSPLSHDIKLWETWFNSRLCHFQAD